MFFIIGASFLTAISISYISIISISWNCIKSYSFSSNLSSNNFIKSAPDLTWNSNWSIWKTFYSIPSRLLENPADLHVKSWMKSRNWMTWTGRSTTKDVWVESWDYGEGTAIAINSWLVTISPQLSSKESIKFLLNKIHWYQSTR